MTRPTINRARRLRRESTFSEAVLWRMVRGRGFENLKFRRQVPIGFYVVDFACMEQRLIVELDGGIHDAPFYDRAAQDQRDAWLRSQGFRLLRFRNSEVENTPHQVFERIMVEIGGR